MAQPYVGEIRMMGNNFAPTGWAFCAGQLLSIAEYQTLYQLLGTTYGGDGVSSFGLPNLCARFPIHQGTGYGASYAMGQLGGSPAVTLITPNLPAHTHAPICTSTAASGGDPAGNVPALGNPGNYYSIEAIPTVPMAPGAVQMMGGSQPHENVQPYVAINFVIALFGVYPSQG